MVDRKPYACQHLWEWWLNDYMNSTVTVMPRGDRYKRAQQLVDDWGAYRRKLLSWADKITEVGIDVS
jgi:hypothetical protein